MRGGNHHEQSDDVMFDSDRYFQTTGCSHDLSRIPCKPAGLPASHDCVGRRRCGGLPELQESAASESCGLQLEKELAVRKRRTGGTSPIQRVQWAVPASHPEDHSSRAQSKARTVVPTSAKRKKKPWTIRSPGLAPSAKLRAMMRRVWVDNIYDIQHRKRM